MALKTAACPLDKYSLPPVFMRKRLMMMHQRRMRHIGPEEGFKIRLKGGSDAVTVAVSQGVRHKAIHDALGGLIQELSYYLHVWHCPNARVS